MNLNAAGLDIGAAEISTFIPSDRDALPVHQFSTDTVDLYRLADWLVCLLTEKELFRTFGERDRIII